MDKDAIRANLDAAVNDPNLNQGDEQAKEFIRNVINTLGTDVSIEEVDKYYRAFTDGVLNSIKAMISDEYDLNNEEFVRAKKILTGVAAVGMDKTTSQKVGIFTSQERDEVFLVGYHYYKTLADFGLYPG